MRNFPYLPMALLCAFLGTVAPAHAQEVPAVADAPVAVVETAVPAKPATPLEAVRQARATLKALLAERLKTEKQPYAVNMAAVGMRVNFAVWDKKTGDIAVVEGMKDGTKLVMVTPGAPKIRVTYNGRLFSQYAVDGDKMVVGTIYPQLANVGTKKKPVYRATDVVYVPYSAEYYRPDVLAAGSDYLSYLIQDAYDELAQKGIGSRAFPGKKVVDVIDPYLVKSIAVIEQTDHATLLGDTEAERGVGRFLVKVAINEEGAFSQAISTAGAAGMVQFIPSTYALMVKNRPDLGLIPDFRAGMADHRNAVKAQVAYLDESLADMPAAVRTKYEKDRASAADVLAAAYNGGSGRVRKALIAYGEDAWDVLHRNKRGVLHTTSLRPETVTYVAKLRRTYGMFTAGYFATPNAPSGALPVVVVPATLAVRPVAMTPASQICFADGGCTAAQ